VVVVVVLRAPVALGDGAVVAVVAVVVEGRRRRACLMVWLGRGEGQRRLARGVGLSAEERGGAK